jgi:hypothetical protein
VHEIAESGSCALSHFVLAAASFTEIRDWRKFSVNWTTSEPSIVELLCCSLCVFFATEFDVDVADEMVSEVVANIHFLNLSIFIFELHENILKEVVVMLLHLFVRNICNH